MQNSGLNGGNRFVKQHSVLFFFGEISAVVIFDGRKKEPQ